MCIRDRDDTVGLHLFAHIHDLLHDGVEAGVVGVQGELLSQKADAGVPDAGQIFNGLLHLGSATGAVQVGEVKTFFHTIQ